MRYLRVQVVPMMEIRYYDIDKCSEGHIFCRITCGKSKYNVTMFPDDEAMRKIDEFKTHFENWYLWPVRVFEAKP